MKMSKSWLIAGNLVLFLAVVTAPFLLPVQWLIFHELLYALCYVIGFVALLLALWIVFAEEISSLIKMGNFVVSVATIAICAYFAFILYSCGHMSF